MAVRSSIAPRAADGHDVVMALAAGTLNELIDRIVAAAAMMAAIGRIGSSSRCPPRCPKL
jgi:hypothetical protein